MWIQQHLQNNAMNAFVGSKERERIPSSIFIGTQASQAKNTWCKGQFVHVENCTGKSPILKKMRY